VDDGETLAVLDDLERRRVLAPVQLDWALARQPEAARTTPIDLDARAGGDRPNDARPPRARVGARAAELVHHDGHPVQLDAARVLDDRDADRARRVRRGEIGRAHVCTPVTSG